MNPRWTVKDLGTQQGWGAALKDLDSHLQTVTCFSKVQAFETAATTDFKPSSRGRWEWNSANFNMKQLRFHCCMPDEQLESAGEHVGLWSFQNAVLGDSSVTKNVWSAGLWPELGLNVSENCCVKLECIFPMWPTAGVRWRCHGLVSQHLQFITLGQQQNARKQIWGLHSNWRAHFSWRRGVSNNSHSSSAMGLLIPGFYKLGEWVRFEYCLHSAHVKSLA